MGSNRFKYSEGFWEEHKEEIINQYESGISANKIAQQYDCWGSTIIDHLNEWNIKIRNDKKHPYNNLYNLDIHFFDKINTEEKAYWLGYIFADGHITKNGHLMFGCHIKDKDILYKARNSFKSTHSIQIKSDENKCILNINSRYISDRLFEIGFTNKKSWVVDFNKILSNIPVELLHHFVRGMFDGDGSIRYYNYKYATGYQYHFGYTGLYEVCEFVAGYLKLKTKIIRERDTNTYTIKSANALAIKYIYGILYKDATVYCDRKYETFNKVLELIHDEKKDVVKGVSWYKNSNQWMASCHMNKINKTIGYYNTKYEAEYARLKYEYDNFGYDASQFYFFDEYHITETN